MTAGRVPLIPALPSAGLVKIGDSVAGRTHAPLAELLNWSIGRGACLVAAHWPMETINIANSAEYVYRIWPRVAAFRRLWSIELTGDGSGFNNPVEIDIDGATFDVDTADFLLNRRSHPVYLVLSSVSTAEATTTLTLTNNGFGDVIVRSIICYELPRFELQQNTTDWGTHVSSCRPKEPIWDVTGLSIDSLCDAAVQAEALNRRSKLFTFAQSSPLTTTSGTLGDMFGLDPVLLGRLKHRSATTSKTTWRAYVEATDGTTSGEIVITATGGDSLTIDIPTGTTSKTWLPSAGGHLEVDAEDLSTADGRRGAAWDEVSVQWRRTAGAGTVRCYSLEAGESTLPPIIADPTEVSGLVCWLRADRGVTLTSGAVSTWADQSGNGHDFTQSTSSDRPTVSYADSNFNDKDALAFDGASAGNGQHLDGPNFSTAAGMTSGEGFFVLRAAAYPPTSGDEHPYLFDSDTTGAGPLALHTTLPRTSLADVREGFGSTAIRTFTGTLPDTTTPFVWSVWSETNDLVTKRNGATFGSHTTNTTDWNYSTALGASSDDANYAWKGEIAEFILFDGKLATADRNKILHYLERRYGMSMTYEI